MEKLISNYIYLYHIDKFILIPTYPENMTNSIAASFNETTPLSRSAPIYSYSHSGPRQVQITLSLHREMMDMLNYNTSNIDLDIGDDYIDTMVNQLQAVALPKYSSGSKMVNPPLVAVRFGNDIFIKGVVIGGVSTTVSGPILANDKYAQVQVTFNVYEVDPFDADTVQKGGLFAGTLNTSLERNLYKA